MIGIIGKAMSHDVKNARRSKHESTMTSQNDYRKHLNEQGWLFGQTDCQLRDRLRRLMGSERYFQFESAAARYRDGETGIEPLYESVMTVEEANVFMSGQAEVALAVGRDLAARCICQAPQEARVLDLGCWSGSLTTFMAGHRPDVRVVGVDRVGHLVEAATAQYGHLRNARFEQWDYRAGPLRGRRKFDVIVGGCAIDFCPLLPRHYDLPVRESQGHATSLGEAVPYFRNWRRAARDDAYLAVALRVDCFPHAVAIIDAATDAGWAISLKESDWIEVGDERLPAFTFRAAPSTRIDEEQLLDWCQFERQSTQQRLWDWMMT